jgi:hypothetical protein
MNTWSPDARCNHRKACLIAAKERCIDPLTHDDTVSLLTRLWTNSTDFGSPSKRSRCDGGSQPISPILAGQAVDHNTDNDRGAVESPLQFDRCFNDSTNELGEYDLFEARRTPTWPLY